MVTQLTFALLHNLKMNVREMHSRKPQLYRTRISDEFRESKRLILVTSDVSSRGMNYPDVTLVLQVSFDLLYGYSVTLQCGFWIPIMKQNSGLFLFFWKIFC